MHRIVLPFCAVALAACTSLGRPPWRDDFERCEQEAGRSPNLQTTQQRFAFVDRCMEAKGWRATAACRESQLEGSPAFCDYGR
jgi:hypothetical protein